MPLVNEIAIFIDANLADKVLIDWFVKDPDKIALPLTQVHSNTLLNSLRGGVNPYVPKYCLDGVTYTDGFDTFNKILVRDIDVQHSDLLDVESPTGRLLDGVKTGESTSDGKIRLLERLPPYVAAFRLASQLRNKSNDGTDVFKILTMPSNEEELIPYMEKVIRHFSPKEENKKIIINNPNIPLTMIGAFTHSYSPVQGAIHHLTTQESMQNMQLFSSGIQAPNKVIIDVYTAVYFALMGFASNLAELPMVIILSDQTRHTLEVWLKDILREDYLSLDVSDHGLHRYTAKDIKKNSLSFTRNLQILLDSATTESLQPQDTPDELIKIRDIIDVTVYSSFQLSIANSIPWLCVDHVMCTLSHSLGNQVVDINSIVMQLLSSSSLEIKRKSIQLNLLSGTPVPILYDDIIMLSRSSESSDTYLVAKFIEKYGVSLDSPDINISFLAEVVVSVIVNAYLDGAILQGGRYINPRYDGHAEHVFNVCCRVAIEQQVGKTAEQRLALFLSYIVLKFGKSNRYNALLSRLASAFAMGHFLDIRELNRSLESCVFEPGG